MYQNPGDVLESSKTPGRYAQYDGKGWKPMPQGWNPPAGAKVSRAGAGAGGAGGAPAGREGYQLRPGETYGPDGSVWYTGPRGGRVKIGGAPESASDISGAGTGQMKMRLGLALGPSVTAQDTLEQYERSAARDAQGGKVNVFGVGVPIPKGMLTATPLQNDWGAATLDSIATGWNFKGDAKPKGPAHILANSVGGDDYRNYNQASETFVTSLLPVFSGAQVTDSEAIRFARANVPQYSDGPDQLQRKALNRKMLLNYAATVTGEEIPFPEVGTWQAVRPRNNPPPGPPRKQSAPQSSPPKKQSASSGGWSAERVQ